MRKLVWVSWLALAVPAWAAQPVHARHAMVVTAEQHATDAGVAVLEAGGNAVDAAVGGGAAAGAVVCARAAPPPGGGTSGGGGFLRGRFPGAPPFFISFRGRNPPRHG